jgi:hypothetical protein
MSVNLDSVPWDAGFFALHSDFERTRHLHKDGDLRFTVAQLYSRDQANKNVKLVRLLR